ncbi:hypothetical protein [Streptomyces sp. 4F14]|uniref:hypothetical protein n=1 Tax=Streptomyces sp. 4F14 TaxID=3394380 RepID=UPI003A88748F
MIAEAIDTLITLGWAMAGWLIVLSAVFTVLILATSTIGAYAATLAWRHLIRPSWAYGRTQARNLAARHLRRPTGHTAPHDYREAA